MQIFINTNGVLTAECVDVESSMTIGELMKKAYPKIKNNSDFEEDNEVYLKNKKEDLDKGKTLAYYNIQEGDTLFIGKCKLVKVKISYMGNSFEFELPPSAVLNVLKKKAAKELGMTDEEVNDFQFLQEGKALLKWKSMIGSYVNYPCCQISLVFAPKKDINGFCETLEDKLAKDLCLPDYLSGEIDGDWGLVENEKEPSGSFFVFWVLAKDGLKYYLRFDLTGYPKVAPTAIFWNIETKSKLLLTARPNWSKRCLQAFKDWGKDSLYLPGDRVAFVGHSDWPAKYPELVWVSEKDTIYKYLNEVHQILN